jgi:hypothetical protein
MVTRLQAFAVAIIAVITVAVVASALCLEIGKRPSTSLHWNVNIGDEFIYELENTYIHSEENYNSTIFALIAAINHTRIKTEIFNLPDIPLMIDGKTFSFYIVNQNKIHCSFENGTSLPQEYGYIINQPLSSALLPVGDWELLDWCFGNEIDEAFYPGTYTSRLQENSFSIGYELWAGDEIFRWSANTTLDSGVPQKALIEIDSLSVGLHFIFRFSLVAEY